MSMPKASMFFAVAALAGSAQAQWSTIGNVITYNSGAVGIGTNNPAGQLDVRSTGTRTISSFNPAMTGYNYAVHGTSLSNNGRGVYGIAQNTGGNGFGVYGVSNGFIGRGVNGYATSNAGGAAYGVGGKSNSSGGAGVFGESPVGFGVLGTTGSTAAGNSDGSGAAAGVRGVLTSTSPGGYSAGVWGINNSTTVNGIGVAGYTAGTGYGVYGRAAGANGYAAYFQGDRSYFSGNLGIGDNTPDAKLDVAGDMKIRTGDKIYFGAISDNTDPVYITRVNFGTNQTILDLVVGDDASNDISVYDYVRFGTTGGGNQFWFGTNGEAWKPGGGAWSAASDARVKRDVRALSGSLDRLLELRGVSFYYNDLEVPGASAGLQTGFIAQEVEKVFPEWVSVFHGPSKYDDLKTVSISGFEALAVEALRELRAENERRLAERDAEIAALQTDNAELHGRLDRLEALIARLAAEPRD